MSVQVENLEKNMAKLTIEVPAEELEKAIESAYQKQKKQISVPGFRKGKVPRAMIEKMYGAGVFYEDAANTLMQQNYPSAVDESGIDIVSRPTVEVVLTISTGGTADISRYCKMDSAPVVFKDIIFRPFIDILKSNYYMIDSLKTKLQENIDVLLKFREARQQKEGLSDTEIGYLEIEDDILIEKMTKGVIDDLGEMKYCLSYEENQIVDVEVKKFGLGGWS